MSTVWRKKGVARQGALGESRVLSRVRKRPSPHNGRRCFTVSAERGIRTSWGQWATVLCVSNTRKSNALHALNLSVCTSTGERAHHRMLAAVYIDFIWGRRTHGVTTHPMCCRTRMGDDFLRGKARGHAHRVVRETEDIDVLRRRLRAKVSNICSHI